ncbi:MAG TPA: helix-turn-helix domain-containing protein [Candidatus Babeliaceae bacterium]|nr:helix-turn-helix domain-containing protein [Candidatus Babeliaceae bacterium]
MKLYESVGSAGVVCLRCGITRPTLLKWLKGYNVLGIEGLSEHSRRPHKMHTRITTEDEQRILDLRVNRKLGHRSTASGMKRLYDRSLSMAGEYGAIDHTVPRSSEHAIV